MRSSNTLAGTSFGSCGTNFPVNAHFNIACRSRFARCRLAWIANSWFVYSGPP